ncbi:beta-lactamase-like protein [Cercophora scortea]|uniref:Beta-lactamase-like protein n=1 Tax=Cercophora scortea TaxID=314031 RepID=A0AAE0MCA0_9PEZI|nr:beta-lactamase-like protein [Cercophora scortea]
MLPPAQDDQTFVAVSPILGGEITLPEKYFIDPADPAAYHTVPSLAFLIQHPKLNRRIMFDLGLRSSIASYSSPQQLHLTNREPHTIGPGVAAVLQQGGLSPLDVDTVILSHVHYDHHGDPDHFPRAQFIVGPGTTHLLEHGLGSSASHQHFSDNLLPADRTVELPAVGTQLAKPTESTYNWELLGPFSAIDLFSDGSIFILNSPGHLPGHINLLCRLSANKWVCLCGDAYHDRRLLTGERDIAFWDGADGAVCCIHNNPAAAREALGQLRELAGMGDVEMIGAHDVGWYKGNLARMFPQGL